MENLLSELQKITAHVQKLESKFDKFETSNQFGDWVSRQSLMKFLDYGDTQMAALIKSGELKVSEIGNRKFIYKPSIIKFLQRNVKNYVGI